MILTLIRNCSFCNHSVIFSALSYAAASQFAALYSLGSFKNSGEQLFPHGYIMPSVFTICGKDMVLCSQIQA